MRACNPEGLLVHLHRDCRCAVEPCWESLWPSSCPPETHLPPLFIAKDRHGWLLETGPTSVDLGMLVSERQSWVTVVSSIVSDPCHLPLGCYRLCDEKGHASSQHTRGISQAMVFHPVRRAQHSNTRTTNVQSYRRATGSGWMEAVAPMTLQSYEYRRNRLDEPVHVLESHFIGKSSKLVSAMLGRRPESIPQHCIVQPEDVTVLKVGLCQHIYHIISDDTELGRTYHGQRMMSSVTVYLCIPDTQVSAVMSPLNTSGPCSVHQLTHE